MSDSESQPLIANHGSPPLYLFFSVFAACISSVQYGYHMSELNAPEAVYTCQTTKAGLVGDFAQTWFGLHGYTECIPLEPKEIGIITSIFSIGGLVGSLYSGRLGDAIGRRTTFALNGIIFMIGSLVETGSNTYWSLLSGRFISGIAAGSSIVMTPLYINEISPVELRGLLGSMNQVCINIGILLTQLLAIRWANDEQWRFLLLMGAVLGFFNFAFCFVIDESPKWLADSGNQEKATLVLQRLMNISYKDSQATVRQWGVDNAKEADGEKVSVWSYLSEKKYSRSRNVVNAVMVGQQFCGINSIIFYGVKVLLSLFPNGSILINCVISVLNTIFTFAASFFMDKAGRRLLLLLSVSTMCVATVGMACGIVGHIALLSVMSTFLYIVAFAIGLGPIPFLLISEVTEPEVKGLAQSWGTALNWLATFAVGFLFPILNNKLKGYTYFIFTGMCVLFGMFTFKNIPETKGKTSFQQVWQGV